MGVIISSAVIPSSLTLLWAGQNKWAATLSPPIGLVCSLIAWLVTAKKQGGNLSVASTGANNPMLAGNVVALLSPLPVIAILTLIFGLDHYDWSSMSKIRLANDNDLAQSAHLDPEQIPDHHHAPQNDNATEQAQLLRASKIAKTVTLILTVSFLVLWPMPMYGSGYIFSKKFFTGWVVVGILWLFISMGCVGLFPLWEGRKSMARTFRAVWKDVKGEGRQVGRVEAQPVGGEDSEGEGKRAGGKVGEEK